MVLLKSAVLSALFAVLLVPIYAVSATTTVARGILNAESVKTLASASADASYALAGC